MQSFPPCDDDDIIRRRWPPSIIPHRCPTPSLTGNNGRRDCDDIIDRPPILQTKTTLLHQLTSKTMDGGSGNCRRNDDGGQRSSAQGMQRTTRPSARPRRHWSRRQPRQTGTRNDGITWSWRKKQKRPLLARPLLLSSLSFYFCIWWKLEGVVEVRQNLVPLEKGTNFY
jgi:hypothetical protein